MILTLLVLTVPQTHVRADDGVDISQFPQTLSDALGIPLIAGQMLASMLFLCLFLFPTMLLTNKRSNQFVAIIFVGLGCLGVTVALTWLPYWFFLIICMIVALMFAGTMRDLITGKGR